MGLTKNASVMGAAVFISRLLGLVREQVFAFMFGAGMVSDAFLVAFRIPNLFRDLLAEGAMSSAFVSVFSKVDSVEDKKKIAKATLTALTFLLFIVCTLIIWLAPYVVPHIASGFSQEEGKLDLTILLTQILSPFLFFTSCAALVAGILNTQGLFFIPALGPAAFNFFGITSGVFLAWLVWSEGPVLAMIGFTLGTLFGGFMQWGLQWPFLWKQGFNPLSGLRSIFSFTALRESFQNSSVKKIGLMMGPAILGQAAVQINVLINTFFAAQLVSGSVTWLNFAFRFLHFPLGLVGVSLSTAALPRLSTLLKNDDRAGFQKTLEEALFVGITLSFAASCVLWVFGEPIIAMIYEHGRFKAFDTIMTNDALSAYTFGLTAFIFQKLFISAYYAEEKILIPSIVSMVSILFNYLLQSFLSEHFGHAGLAMGTSLSIWLQVLCLGYLLHKRGRFICSTRLFKSWSPIFMAGLIFLFCFLIRVDHWLLNLHLNHSWFIFASATLFCISVSGIGYLGLVTLLLPPLHPARIKIISILQKLKILPQSQINP